MSEDVPKKIKTSRFARLRNYFLTGLIICAPLAITAYLVWTIIEWVDGWVKPYIPSIYNPDNYLPFAVPGFGLIVAFLIVTMVGFLTANYIGRSIVGYGEDMLNRMPVVRNLYLFAIVFIATDTRGEVDSRLKDKGHETISVFLPTTPNPTSGFLLFVPKKDIVILDMGVEEAAKLVISAGLVAPEYETLAKTRAKKK